MISLALAVLLAQTPAPAPAPKSLTLEQALQTAVAQQPTLRQAHATTEVQGARAAEQFAPILPSVNLTSSLTLQSRRSSVPNNSLASGDANINSNVFWSAGLTANETIWDFEQNWGRYKAARFGAEAQADTEKATAVQVALNVRTAYFTARAQKDLVDVALSSLKNQQAHFEQTQGFVQVGTRPEIDLAQARANLANAKVQRITAENGYATAKARLNQAMGVEGTTDYEVTDSQLAAVPGEDGALDALVERAVQARPESAAYEAQIAGQQYALRAARGGYWPTLGVSLGATVSGAVGGGSSSSSTGNAGDDGSGLKPNLRGQLTLDWNLFSGGATRAQVREAEYQLIVLQAERDAFRLQVRVDVQQAQLQVQAAKQTLSAAEEAQAAAQVQLQLAEGRYQAGVGNIIELSDAQAGLTNAAAQRVQALYSVATARAQLMAALGQR